MKRNLIILSLFALMTSACSSSLQISGGNIDDLYYWPGDNPPVYAGEELPNIGSDTKTSNEDLLIISEVEKGKDGTNTLNNYIYADDEPDWYSDVQARNIQIINDSDQDTLTIPYEEDGTYIVNNYYMDDDDYYYSNRLRFFHDPYYYDPYWNFSFNWGWGSYYYSPFSRWNSWYWDPWYYSSWGWYDPWYYNSWGWYNPWYYGSYYGYYSWNYPYYNHNYYDNHHYNDWYDRDNKNYNESSRRSRNLIGTYGGGVGMASNTRTGGNETVGATTNKSVSPQSRRTVINASEGEVTSRNNGSTDLKSQTTQPRVLTEKRRSVSGSENTNNSQNRSNVSGERIRNAEDIPAYRSPSTTERRVSVNSSQGVRSNSERSNYTPSYNKPRTNTRATYNTNRTSSNESRYNKAVESRQSVGSSTNRANTYSQPAQSNSKSSYQIPSRSSTPRSYGSSGSSGSSYRSGSTQSSSPSRSYSSGSSPSRSYSSGSSSSSSSGSSIRSSSGSSGSFSGGSSHSSSGSSSHSSSGSSSSGSSSHSSSPSRR